MADHVAVAGRWREDVEACGGGRRCRRAAGALCRAQEKGEARTGRLLPDHRHPGGRARRVLDPSRAAGRRHRKPCRRSGLDRDLAPAAASQDRQDRRRGAGAGAAGLQAGRAAGVRDGQGADARGRGSPPHLARAQGADQRADPARQSHQGTAVRQGVSGYEPLRRDRRERLDELKTGDGRPLPII